MSTKHAWKRTFKREPREPEHRGWNGPDLERMNVELRADQRKHDIKKLITLTPEEVENIVCTILVRFPSIYRKPVEATVHEVLAVLVANVSR